MGRFTQMDPSRQERNAYLYSYSNPLNYTDPTGNDPCPPFIPGCEAAADHRNLTYWLVDAMKTNAQSEDIAEIRDLNERSAIAAALIPMIVILVPGEQGNCLTNEAIEAAHNLKMEAGEKFTDLVKAGARWDHKGRLLEEVGENIRLCGLLDCRWYRYDVIANIHFGYIGRAAGFTGLELHVGTGQAQSKDTPGTGVWYALGDDPLDYNAVQMGIDLFNWAKPTELRISTFRAMLGLNYFNILAQGTRPPMPYWQDEFPTDPKFGPKFLDNVTFKV